MTFLRLAAVAVSSLLGCRSISPHSEPLKFAALQDSGAVREMAMELPEDAVRLSPLKAARAEVVPATGREGSNLKMVFTLAGCLDSLGPVLHSMVKGEGGRVEVYILALNIHTKASMAARCASLPTATHEISLGGRVRTMANVTVKWLEKVPLGAPGEGSLMLTETMKSLKATLAEVESASVSMPRCIQGRPCPPPTASIGLFYSMGCLSSLGPVLYGGEAVGGNNSHVRLFVGAVEVIDSRASRAFCVAPAMARVVAHVDGVDPGGFEVSQVRITNLAPSRSASRPNPSDDSGVTVDHPDPDGTYLSCEAYWTGWYVEDGVCRQGGSSGCANPFPWSSLDECRRAQSIPGPNQGICRAVFSGFNWNAELKACEVGYASGCSNPFSWKTLDECLAANAAGERFGLRSGDRSTTCTNVFEGWYLNPAKPRRCVGGTFHGCSNPFEWSTYEECRVQNNIRR